MSPSAHSEFDIGQVILNKTIETHFQPIVSIRRKSILGGEALSRGLSENGELVSPQKLFEQAAARNNLLELDRACRVKALENFLPVHQKNPDLILFLNCYAASLAEDFDFMLESAETVGIDVRNIAIEILESECEDVKALRKSIQKYKKAGFLMAIDDLGIGHSNLNRIFHIEPDIIKADASLVRDINLEYYKQEIFKSLTHLSEKIGGWIIAEGVETEDEALTVMKLGGDIMQGYYFGRPLKRENQEIAYSHDCVETVAVDFKEYTLNKIKNDYYLREERAAVINSIAAHLINLSPEQFEKQLCESVAKHSNIESACVIDEKGVQMTNTVINDAHAEKQKTVIFRPPVKGSDHSLKEYFYALKETRIKIFETNPYVPLPSGNLCITVSTFFKDASGQSFILCLHMRLE